MLLLVTVNLVAFSADCNIYPYEELYYNNGSYQVPNHEASWKLSITTGNRKLIISGKNNKKKYFEETYYYKSKSKNGNFIYANNEIDYITISLGKIKNNNLTFTRGYTNGDWDYGNCKLK